MYKISGNEKSLYRKVFFLVLILLIIASLGFKIFSQNNRIGYVPETTNNVYSMSGRFFADSADSLLGDSSLTSILSDSLINFKRDSIIADSIANVDSLKIDSTARLQNLKLVRSDNYAVNFREEKKSSLYAYPTGRHLRRTVELDSTGQYVLIKESIAGKEEKLYLKLKLEDYIDLKLKAINRNIWEDLAYKYEIKQDQKDLSALITDITNIEIPLPSTAFLSIFGPNVIKLRINGSVDIHGAWRSETTEGLTASRLGNTRNEPDFSQQVQISVMGTIGDKLSINADWNTERTFEYENQLKIKYTGYDDEIIQSVEAGNVSLQTSSLVGGSEALFGIKALMKLGPFSLTALASQKKGEVKEVSLSGGSEKQQFEIHAYQYSTNHYFVDKIYADTTRNWFFNNYGSAVANITPENAEWQIIDLEVWKTTTGLVDQNRERRGNAFLNLPPITRTGTYEGSEWKDSNRVVQDRGAEALGERWVKLNDGVDYSFDQYAGFISFKSAIQETEALAVAMRVNQGPGEADDLFFGEFTQDLSDTSFIVLKLIKPKNLNPNYKDAWKLQLRNIYPIGGRDIKKEDFKLDIFYRIEGQEPRNDYEGYKLLEIFGLDKTNDAGSGGPDGAFDWNTRTIIPITGEIIFPRLRPFGKDIPSMLPDSLRYNAVYDTLKSIAPNDRTKDKFLIMGEYSASVSSVYNIGFNVVENSVRVTLNGAELKEGVDYAVDYNIGQITIRNAAALVPGADLKISYEQNDLFALASKTLIGLRGLFEFGRNTKLGFSFLNLNQKTLSDKVRIGEEPLNNSIYGVDFEHKMDLPFITKALDNVISTRANSSWDVKGEFAYINPDPNTKKSTIEGDGNKSIAYLDDFEGSKRIIPIGVTYTSWKDLSPPYDLPTDTLNALMAYKAKSFWFNILPSDVRVDHIWPERQVSRQDQQVTALDFVYRPYLRGMYNNFPKIGENPFRNWGGMMKYLSSTANNLEEENIEFIEFWAKIIKAPSNAKMRIDIGLISEDVIPNGKLDTEDPDGNDNLAEGEDRGLDFLSDRNEEGSGEYPEDPAGDNFSFVQGSLSTEDYMNINGTEGNALLTDIGRFPDTEDLNRNFTLDRLNSFFRYEIPLDTVRENNPFITGGGSTDQKWFQFKIPLKEFVDQVGDPSFTTIEYIRVWFTETEEEVHLRLTEFNFVGNQWQKVLRPPIVDRDDSVMTISTINLEDNPGYIVPPGVKRERDRSKPDEKVFKNEQSLQLLINELEDGQRREAVKYLFRPLDVFSYSEMKLFVRGDDNRFTPDRVSYYESSENYGAEIYFRFGSDSLNYYEYRQPVNSDTSGGRRKNDGWNEIRIIFDEVTAIKERRDKDTAAVVYSERVAGKADHFYGIRGNPTLTRVTFFMIGILNPHDKGAEGTRVSGDIWVNELRVLGADDTPGWAYTVSTSVKFADLLSVSFNMKQTDPYFHGLNERFGSRIDKKSWGVTANLDLLKMIPANLEGSNLSVNYSHTESFSQPLYKPNTDILVEEAAKASNNPDSVRNETHTVGISDTWTLSNIRIRVPNENWYIKHTLNSLTFGFSYNKTFGRNPTTLSSKTWVWNAKADYNLNLGNENYFYPVKIPLIGDFIELFIDYRNVKVFYLPQSFTSGVSAKRNRNFSQPRALNVSPNIQQDFTATRSFGFNWEITDGGFLNLGLNYTADFSSSLTHLLTTTDGAERKESDIIKDIFTGAFFGRDNNFRQSFDLKTSPKLPSIWDINRYFNITAGYNVTYNWQWNFQQEELGRSAGYANRISAGLRLRLKALMDPLFEDAITPAQQTKTAPARTNRGRTRTQNVDDEVNRQNQINLERNADADSTNNAVPDSLAVEGESQFTKVLRIMKSSARYVLFDYEQISFNFSQNNQRSGGGLASPGTGFTNFWGIRQKDEDGPSRLFMLGLENDLGPRAPGGTLNETFSQKNSVDFKTSRPLWEGASIDLSWNLNWGYNRNQTVRTDSTTGEVTIVNIASSGNIDRSFLSLPVSFFKSDLKKVNSLYDPRSPNQVQNLSDAFVSGLETFPLISKLPLFKDISKFIPRPNWKINWAGLEKISFLEGIAKKVSLNHGYSSSFSEGWKISPDRKREIQSQKISYGFAPLLGISITFEEIWGGNIQAQVNYSLKTNYDLGIATKNISESFSKDINIQASYSKSGFELPLFGVSLKNDIQISFAYTSGQNSVVIYEMGQNFNEKGKPQDGTVRTTIEPRIRYVMSSRVTLAIFYKRSTVEPEGASRIPPTTTNEAGLDVNISIQ